MKALWFGILALSPLAALAQTNEPAPTLIVAIQGDDHPKTNSPGWLTEVGEVYRFVRYMTQSEYLGGSLPTHDRSYVVARIGDAFVVEPITFFTYPTDMAAAEAKIKAEEKELDRQYEQYAKEEAQRRRDQTQEQILQELRSIRQTQQLRLMNGR